MDEAAAAAPITGVSQRQIGTTTKPRKFVTGIALAKICNKSNARA
jgi:hypothetical protein